MERTPRDEIEIGAFFGGFGQTDEDAEPEEGQENAFSQFVVRHPRQEWRHLNFFRGAQLLKGRWEEAQDFLSCLGGRLRAVEIVGYSMGAHVAIRFAQACRANRLHVTLIAPDPKYIESPLDRTGRNAYDEAARFWNGGVPGIELENAIKDLPLSSRTTCWYSYRDSTAVWPNNVERLARIRRQSFVMKEARTPEDLPPGKIHEWLFGGAYLPQKESRSRRRSPSRSHP